jgi:adenosylhomocysteine nucleosidase
MKPMLGLVVALAAEARALLGWGLWQRVGGLKVRRLRLHDGTDIICVRSGVGIENSLSAARLLVTEGVGALASMGVAGGLYPGMKAGDLIIAEVVLEEGNGKDIWEADSTCAERAHSALKASGMPVHRGTVITTHRAVLTAKKKKSLYTQSGALAVDMESASLARAAREANLPFFVLRAVCDAAERSMSKDLSDCLDERGQVRLSFLLRKLLRRPSMVSELLRMRKEFAAALVALKKGWRVQLKNNLSGLLTYRQTGGAKPAITPPRSVDTDQ